jgi:hypothetical protein
MAHFAQLDENNIVTRVIVVDNKDVTDQYTGQEDEILGIAFCKKLFGGNWKQTSYNGNMRFNYAGIGFTYDEQRDAFIPPKPYESWILNEENMNWESPIGPAPQLTETEVKEKMRYVWNESDLTWSLVSQDN